MPNFQQTQIIGHVGRDPEMRYTPSGQAVTSFSVAVTEKYKTANGEEKKSTLWFRVSSWGKQAEVCNQYIKKGAAVMVVGKLKGDEQGNPRMYDKQDGSKGANFEITASQVVFLSSAEKHEQTATASTNQPLAEDEYPF